MDVGREQRHCCWRVADGDVHQQTTKKFGSQSEDVDKSSDNEVLLEEEV